MVTMRAFKNFVNGAWVDAADGRTTAVIDPTTGEQYAQAALSGAADVDVASTLAAVTAEATTCGVAGAIGARARNAGGSSRTV